MKKILDKINGEFGKGEIWAIVCVFILAVGLTICPVLRTLADEIRGLTQYSDTTGKSTRILPIPAINTDTLNKINADRLNLSGISHLTITDTGVKTHTEIDGHINGTGAAVHGLGTASTRADTYFEPAISGDPDTSKYWRADKTWQTVVGGGGGDMYKADNLSGLADAATARGNLGLGTASTHADTEYEDAGALSGHESTYNHANYDTAYSKVNADSASWDAKQSALTSGGDGTAILDGVKIRSLKNSAGITWYVGGDSVRGEVAAVSSGHDILDSAGNTLETTTGIKFMSPFTAAKNGDNAEIGLSTMLDFDSQFYVASTTQTVTHNFANVAVDTTIYDVATNKRIWPDVTFTDANNLSVDMTGWGNRTIRVYVKRPGTTVGGAGYTTTYAIFSDTKASNTAGGTFTAGAWRTRNLQTTQYNNITGCSLGSNQITLPAGTYRIIASAPAYWVNAHKSALKNTTDNSFTLIGTSEYNSTASNWGSSTRSFISGVFTIAAQKVFEIQHYSESTYAGSGFGLPFNNGESEVYTFVIIEKIQ